MDHQVERKIQQHVSAAVSKSLAEFFEKQSAMYKADRDADRRSRKKGVKKVGDGWTEEYGLKVVHYGTVYGRNCTVSIDGCNRYFEIYQDANRPLFSLYSGKAKPKVAPKWNLRMHEGSDDCVLWEHSSEDFESLLQQTIVMMMGHAFMEGSL